MLNFTTSNQRGESLAELLVATFILSAILFVLLSVFLSNRQGIHQSWNNTEISETAAAALEHIKSTPHGVFQVMNDSSTGVGVTSLNPKEVGWDWALSDSFKDYELEIDLLPYLSYPEDELIEVVVRVKQAGGNTWNLKATLLRNEGSP